MRIAVFDYRVLRTNPVGSCHRSWLQAVCHGHDFTVLAVQFDIPARNAATESGSRHAPRRCCSRPTTWSHRSATCSSSGWRRKSNDLVQVVESNPAFGDLSYVHFCYGAFLRKETARRRTVRG